jgi:hypothetical protein
MVPKNRRVGMTKIVNSLLYSMYKFGAFFVEKSILWRVKYEDYLQKKKGNAYVADMQKINIRLKDVEL